MTDADEVTYNKVFMTEEECRLLMTALSQRLTKTLENYCDYPGNYNRGMGIKDLAVRIEYFSRNLTCR